MTAPVPPDLREQLRLMVEREVQRALSSAPSRNQSSGPLTIREGEVRMVYPDDLGGGTAVYFGPLYRDGAYAGSGLLVQAPDGTDILSCRTDNAFPHPVATVYDGGGVATVATDAISGQGLARPYVGGGFAAARWADFRHTVTGTEWETVARAYPFKQHPRLEVGVKVSADTDGTTGQLRVLVDGAPLGEVTDEEFSIATRYFEAPVAGAHMAVLTVEVQARVTAGGGGLRLEPMYWLGRQS